LQIITQDDKSKVLEPGLYENINIAIQKIYDIAFQSSIDQKKGGAGPLQLLNEIEKFLDQNLQFLQKIEENESDRKEVHEKWE